jgi:hypothetical protein
LLIDCKHPVPGSLHGKCFSPPEHLPHGSAPGRKTSSSAGFSPRKTKNRHCPFPQGNAGFVFSTQSWRQRIRSNNPFACLIVSFAVLLCRSAVSPGARLQAQRFSLIKNAATLPYSRQNPAQTAGKRFLQNSI